MKVIAMLKTVSLSACLCLLLAACATTPRAPPTPGAQTAKQAQPPGCVASTGTMLPTQSTSCTGPGNTYSLDQMKRTGATTTSDALRLLDPAVTITH
jgi:hypothetical protein